MIQIMQIICIIEGSSYSDAFVIHQRERCFIAKLAVIVVLEDVYL